MKRKTTKKPKLRRKTSTQLRIEELLRKKYCLTINEIKKNLLLIYSTTLRAIKSNMDLTLWKIKGKKEFYVCFNDILFKPNKISEKRIETLVNFLQNKGIGFFINDFGEEFYYKLKKEEKINDKMGQN